MPIKKAAKKYVRVTVHKTEKNRKIKGQIKSAFRATKDAISAGDAEKAKESFKRYQKALDKASQKKVMKKNTVARRKSRLNKIVKAIQNH